jgi:hypothetical protein
MAMGILSQKLRKASGVFRERLLLNDDYTVYTVAHVFAGIST